MPSGPGDGKMGAKEPIIVALPGFLVALGYIIRSDNN